VRIRHQGTWREVVGVVADVKYSDLAGVAEPTIYVPFDQYPTTSVAFVFRTRSVLTLRAVRDAVRAVVPDAAATAVDPLPSLLTKSYARERYRTVLMIAFAVLASLITAVGMYGVGARAAAQRTREVGIRLALGSTRGAIARLMVGNAMRGVVIGLAVGLPATFALRRFVQPFLFGVQPTDAVAYIATVALLGLAMLLASYAPSRRTSRSDPALVLRGD
jgi:putative ABC transport system permease protein